MANGKFDTLKRDVQEIIDLINKKDFQAANNKLTVTNTAIDDLHDFLKEDTDLIEISRYQVLMNQLKIKIIAAI